MSYPEYPYLLRLIPADRGQILNHGRFVIFADKRAHPNRIERISLSCRLYLTHALNPSARPRLSDIDMLRTDPDPIIHKVDEG